MLYTHYSLFQDQIEDRMRFVIFFILYGISLIELVLFSFAEKGQLDETVSVVTALITI